MRKKIISILSFIVIFILFGIAIYCIFDGSNVSASEKEEVVKENNIIKKEKNVKEKETIYVDIKGAVNNPGVYEMNNDSRVVDVIKEAGGLLDDADTNILNLSKKVDDEMYIIIYTKDEIKKYKDKLNSKEEIKKELEKEIVCPDSDNDACLKNSDSSKSNLININTASKEELESLSGIGSSKAESIIEYRKKNKFNAIEDLKNVSGIGDSLYEKIKDNIEV